MKNKKTSLVLFLIMAGAAPAFADSIYSEHLQDVEFRANGRDFQFGSFKAPEYRIARESDFGLSYLGKEDKNSDRFVSFNNFDDHSQRPFGRDWKHADPFAGNSGSDWGKGNLGENNGYTQGASSTTPVAEPGAQTLLLFGLAGLGLFAFRRNSFKNAA